MRFNTTCCEEKGIPKICMGNCMSKGDGYFENATILGKSYCGNYRNIIDLCIIKDVSSNVLQLGQIIDR